MSADDLYEFLASVPRRLAADADPKPPTVDLPDGWGDLDADVAVDADPPDRFEETRRELLATLGYEPDDVTRVEPDAVEDRGRIVAGLPVVDHDLPMARRFVLRVGEDPARDPPTPDTPEAVVYPTLRLVRETLADQWAPVDYALQLTEARLVVDGPAVSRTYVLPDVDAGDAVAELPSFEVLTRRAAADLYAWLAVDAGPDEQTSIAEF